jgi:hypothetical protein
MSVSNPPENGDALDSGDFGSSIPRPLHSTKSFRVLGDLILPSPSTCGLLQEHEELVVALRPHLDRMHARDLSSRANGRNKEASLTISQESPNPFRISSTLSNSSKLERSKSGKTWA